jgi:hypothetical protein
MAARDGCAARIRFRLGVLAEVENDPFPAPVCLGEVDLFCRHNRPSVEFSPSGFIVDRCDDKLGGNLIYTIRHAAEQKLRAVRR